MKLLIHAGIIAGATILVSHHIHNSCSQGDLFEDWALTDEIYSCKIINSIIEAGWRINASIN